MTHVADSGSVDPALQAPVLSAQRPLPAFLPHSGRGVCALEGRLWLERMAGPRPALVTAVGSPVVMCADVPRVGEYQRKQEMILTGVPGIGESEERGLAAHVNLAVGSIGVKKRLLIGDSVRFHPPRGWPEAASSLS